MKKLLYGAIIPDLWDQVNRCTDAAADPDSCTQNLQDFSNLVFNIIRIALVFVGTIALIYFIYNAMLYMTSVGNPDQAGRGKSGMLYTILGLMLIIFSYSIINFIIGIW